MHRWHKGLMSNDSFPCGFTMCKEHNQKRVKTCRKVCVYENIFGTKDNIILYKDSI